MTTLARIAVMILDERGLVEVRGGEGVSPGVLPDAPSHVRLGAPLRLRVHASALTGVVGLQETLEVQGRVIALEGPRGATGARCREGLSFRLDVEAVATVQDDAELEPWSPSDEDPDAPSPVPDLTELDDDLPTLAMPPQSVSALFQSQRVRGAFPSDAFPSDEKAVPASVKFALPDAPPAAAPAEAPHPELDVEAPPSASSDLLALVEDTEPSGIFGTLREMPLVELLQSLELSRKTAEVILRPKGAPAGQVFLDDGRVVYARAGDLEGEEAFYALAHSRRGAFRIRFHSQPPCRNIDRPTAYLVLEAHRRLDEESRDAAGAAAPTGAEPSASPSQLDDDAPTASERPYPQPRSREPEPVEAAPDARREDVFASAEERAPTSHLFSHFFEEASEEGEPPRRRQRVAHEATLTFTSLQAPLSSTDESRV